MINPSQDKFAELNFNLVYPDSLGSGLIAPIGSPVTIYCSPEHDLADPQSFFYVPGMHCINDALLSQDHSGARTDRQQGQPAFL